MKRLVDSNRYTDFVAGDSDVVGRFQLATELALPTIVLGEVRYGFLSGIRVAQNETTLVNFWASHRVSVLAIDEATTHVYGQLMAHLRRQGTPIPTNDVWIAALAVQHGLPLYTHDNHFDRLPQVARI